MRYDASARFTNAQPINSQRWGTPQIEIYEGATEDPALAYAWAAHGAGTRNWATGDPASAYRCRVGGDVVTFSAWPSSVGEDSTLFEVRPTSTSAASGNGRLNVRAAPDYENPTDSGGDNLYRVRVRNGHNLNDIFGEGLRTGCDGSALELTVRVKDAGPAAPVRSLTGDLDSNTMTIAVDWDSPRRLPGRERQQRRRSFQYRTQVGRRDSRHGGSRLRLRVQAGGQLYVDAGNNHLDQLRNHRGRRQRRLQGTGSSAQRGRGGSLHDD